MTLSKTEGLVALAANVDRNSYPHGQVDLNLLEAAPAPRLGPVENIVVLDCPEFTSLCPMTNQPDFGRFKITYLPKDSIVESKSLKLYLGSFRNSGEFHEACANLICCHLADLIQPHWLVVKGIFMPRGGISINPVAVYHGSGEGIPDWVFMKD